MKLLTILLFAFALTARGEPNPIRYPGWHEHNGCAIFAQAYAAALTRDGLAPHLIRCHLPGARRDHMIVTYEKCGRWFAIDNLWGPFRVRSADDVAGMYDGAELR